MVRTTSLLGLAIVAFYLQGSYAITVADLYTRILEKNRNIEDTFAFQFVRPIGSVAGEYIWPRSYSTSSELMFDENGAAFNLHERPSLSKILQKSRVNSLRTGGSYGDFYNRRK